MNCPWDFLPASPMSFCEKRLCSWVVEPANTWSNIGYLIVALLVLKHDRKDPYGHACLALFFGSTAFHLTGTSLGEFFDLSSMFFLVLAPIVFNFTRLKFVNAKQGLALLILLGVLCSVSLLFYQRFGIFLFALLFSFLVLQEILLYKKSPDTNFTYILKAVGVFFIAFLIWNLDKHGIVCYPHNHILGGHALWHLLVAVVIWLFFQHYRQFEVRAPAVH